MQAKLMASIAMVLFTTASGAGEVMGTWLHESGEAHVRFEPCGDVLCGHIAWIKPGAKTKAGVGDMSFFEMKEVNPSMWQGKALYPDNGKVYAATMRLTGATSLTTSGCALAGLICKTVLWTRLQ